MLSESATTGPAVPAMFARSVAGKVWKSGWWLPVSFASTVTGVGVLFTARPAIVLTLGAVLGVAAHFAGLTKTTVWPTMMRLTIFTAAGVLMFFFDVEI